jgi:hypothetical protein
MAPPFCGRSIRRPGPSLCPWHPSRSAHSVPHATVVSPPRGGRCPRRTLAAGSRVPCNAHSSFPEVQRGASQPRSCGRWALHTQNGPPSVASRKYDLQGGTQPGRLSAPLPLSITPNLVQRDAMPKVGASAVSWRIAVGQPDAASRVRSCAYSGAGSSTHAGCARAHASACSASVRSNTTDGPRSGSRTSPGALCG